MIYIDLFADEYVKEKEVYAPPERYLKLKKGVIEGVFIEKYIVCTNPLKMLDFSYSELEKTDYPELVAFNRNKHLEKNHAFGASMVEYTIPPSHYKNIEDYMAKGGAE